MLFPKPPTLSFAAKMSGCPTCHDTLTVTKTSTRTVITQAIGTFIAHETILGCTNPACVNRDLYHADDLSRLVPSHGKFAYDVIVHVGKEMFLCGHKEVTIMGQLHQQGIAISRSEVALLARKFIVYLAIAHRESVPRIRESMHVCGGYILHLDGTCEGDSPHLMSVLDGMSDMVLENVKLLSENSEQIVPFLQQIKQRYGSPVAVVSDMGKGIATSVETVFPTTPHRICNYHFLRDIGKDLLSEDNDVLRKGLRCHGIQAFLHRHARALKPVVEKKAALLDSIKTCLDNEVHNGGHECIKPSAIAYLLIHWILEGKQQGDGCGFPFDRPYLCLFQRLTHAYQAFDTQFGAFDNTQKSSKRLLNTLRKKIGAVVNDRSLINAAARMDQRCGVFDQLRQAMRIALPDTTIGLNDDGEQNMRSILQQVTCFCKTLEKRVKKTNDKAYAAMLDQLRRYWDKLFSDPVIKNTPDGPVAVYPQRTNNIMERFFRDLRRNYRNRTGSNSMTRALKTMLADTPLISNLKDPTYHKQLLNGAESLEQRFSQIETTMVREQLSTAEQENKALSSKAKRIIRMPGFIKKIMGNCRFSQ